MIGGELLSVAHMPELLDVALDVVCVFDAEIDVRLEVIDCGVTKALRAAGKTGMSGVLIAPINIFPSTSLWGFAPTAASVSACV